MQVLVLLLDMNVGGFGEAPKVITEYMPLFDNVIHIMRFPKFIQIVSEELGKEVSGFVYLLILPVYLDLVTSYV